MKKIILLALLISLIFVSTSYAEYLTTADCLDQGKWALSLAYLSDTYGGGYVSSANALTGSNVVGATGYAPLVSYGIRDNLELGLAYGLAEANGAGTDILAAVLPGGGKISIKSDAATASLKIGLRQEKNKDPFSCTLGIIAKQGTVKTTMPAAMALDSIKTVNSYTLGLLVSKMFIPFIPYAGIGYEVNSYNQADTVYGDSETSLGIVLGSAIFLRENLGTFIEASSRNYTPKTGGGYNIMEYAARVTWLIN